MTLEMMARFASPHWWMLVALVRGLLVVLMALAGSMMLERRGRSMAPEFWLAILVVACLVSMPWTQSTGLFDLSVPLPRSIVVQYGTANRLLLAGLSVWAVGFAFHIARCVAPQLAVTRLSRSCTGGLIAYHDAQLPPMAVGILRQRVLLPRRLRGHALHNAVVAHELAHIRYRDNLVLLVARMLVGVLWMNPLAHVVVRKLVVGQECRADRCGVSAAVSPVDYAELLAEEAKRSHRMAPSPAFAAGILRTRVTRLLSPLSGRVASLPLTVGALVVIGALMLLPKPVGVARMAPDVRSVAPAVDAGTARTFTERAP